MGDRAIANKGDNKIDGYTQPPCLATTGEPHCKCLSFTVDRQSVCDQLSLRCPLENLLLLHAIRNSALASMLSRCTSDNVSWISFKLDQSFLFFLFVHFPLISHICSLMLLLGSMKGLLGRFESQYIFYIFEKYTL